MKLSNNGSALHSESVRKNMLQSMNEKHVITECEGEEENRKLHYVQLMSISALLHISAYRDLIGLITS